MAKPADGPVRHPLPDSRDLALQDLIGHRIFFLRVSASSYRRDPYRSRGTCDLGEIVVLADDRDVVTGIVTLIGGSFSALSASLGFNSLFVPDLFGHRIRIIRPGNPITPEAEPGRVNVYLDHRGIITDIIVEGLDPNVWHQSVRHVTGYAIEIRPQGPWSSDGEPTNKIVLFVGAQNVVETVWTTFGRDSSTWPRSVPGFTGHKVRLIEPGALVTTEAEPGCIDVYVDDRRVITDVKIKQGR